MTVQTLAAAIPAIATVVAAADSIKGTQSLPKDVNSEYPFAMVYLLTGEGGDDVTQGLMNFMDVAVDILAPLEKGLQKVFPAFNAAIDELLVDFISEVITDGGHFSNTIDTFSGFEVYLVPDYPWGGIPMIGYRIVLKKVKLVVENVA